MHPKVPRMYVMNTATGVCFQATNTVDAIDTMILYNVLWRKGRICPFHLFFSTIISIHRYVLIVDICLENSYCNFCLVYIPQAFSPV